MGAADAIRKSAERLYTTEVSHLMDKAPPRALRGRWGSIDKVEGSYVKALQYITNVVVDVFGKSSKRAPAPSVGAEEEEDYQVRHIRSRPPYIHIFKRIGIVEPIWKAFGVSGALMLGPKGELAESVWSAVWDGLLGRALQVQG